MPNLTNKLHQKMFPITASRRPVPAVTSKDVSNNGQPAPGASGIQAARLVVGSCPIHSFLVVFARIVSF